MAQYFVRDVGGDVTVVHADSYSADRSYKAFEFRNLTPAKLVASFPVNTTLSVVEATEAWVDFLPNSESREDERNSCREVEEEESDDEFDGLIEDLLNTEKFIAGVAEIAAGVAGFAVDEYLRKTRAAGDSAEPKLPCPTLVEGTRKLDGKEIFGFLTPDNRLVPYFYDGAEGALEGISSYKNGRRDWYYENPEDYTLKKVGPDVPLFKVVKGVVKTSGDVEYGFVTPEGFVNYSLGPEAEAECIEDAEEGLVDYNNGKRDFHYEEPEDYTFTEVENG